MSIEQIKVVSKAHESMGGYFEMNKADFNPDVMIEWRPEFAGKSHEEVMKIVNSEPKKDVFDGMSKPELRAWLAERGVEAPSAMKEESLRGLARTKAAEEESK